MIQQPKLPWVRFSCEAMQFKDADGHIQFKNKYMAYITPSGGKDELVKDADEWIASLLEKGTTRGPFDSAANEYQTWHKHFSEQLARFKAGEELAVSGTPIRAILAFTKAEIAQVENARIYSLEDLSTCNEEGLRNIGIGARALKDKATQLLASQGANHLAEENNALRVRLEQMEAQMQQLIAANNEAAPEKRGPGRPKAQPLVETE
jgi:antitoxin (DNA-binding transcriptional repressor) of toxin-antitoxin stability system